VFLRERLWPRQALGIAISLGGVVAILSHGSWSELTALQLNRGDVLMLLSVLLWSIYTIGLRWRPPGLSLLSFLFSIAVIGDVAQPGIRSMSRRLTVSEAITEAGGVLPTGNRSKVVVLRRQPTGVLSPIAVNVSAIYKGKAPDNTYLIPGDQVIVPGNKWKTFQKIMSLTSVASFARIFSTGW